MTKIYTCMNLSNSEFKRKKNTSPKKGNIFPTFNFSSFSENLNIQTIRSLTKLLCLSRKFLGLQK